ncbi:bifunctional riboflavin kinase/FAD synthetase [Cytobacillus suaedae]|nr:bifunctional riboflavin kinase/FAD synthetase [Cytobacillus suaedae]
MKIIYISHPHQLSKTELPNTVLALGYFDGVHKGHQSVIKEAINIASHHQFSSAVMTFDPHPSVVLANGRKKVDLLTTIEEKAAIIEELGIDILYIVTFNEEFANLLPQEFIDDYIIGLNVKHVVAGFDFSYGRLGKGTMETLPFHSRGEFEQTTIEKQTHGETKISSTLLRQLINNGQIAEVYNLLGRYFTHTGKVVHGDKRGRTIGFPTANLDVKEGFITPPVGVYAVRVCVSSIWYFGVCNIGFKPTFHKDKKVPTIEVHIFDFDESIYDQEITIEWHTRIRSEKKFANVAELVKQINEDREETKLYFENMSHETCFLR